jgi:hypothetical protein
MQTAQSTNPIAPFYPDQTAIFTFYFIFSRKSLLDQDKAELRIMQDMYLPDGDLHGQGRKRNFRWRGIDSNSQMDLFDNKIWNDDDNGNIELMTEEDCKRRKERFERDTFLREEMVSYSSL